MLRVVLVVLIVKRKKMKKAMEDKKLDAKPNEFWLYKIKFEIKYCVFFV